MYQEYNPHILLSPYIDKYWISQGTVSEEFISKVLPDGCVDIIYAFGSSAEKHSMTDSTPYIIGTATTIIEHHFSFTTEMFGIRFKPGGITAFIRCQLFEFTNSRIELSQIDSLFKKDFYQSFPDTDNKHFQIAHIENYLISRLSKAYYVDDRVNYGLQLITHSSGMISPGKLAEEVCLSPRQFERRFKSIVGVSPKNYCRIMRFRNTKEYIEKYNTTKSLSEIAWDCGYYDHSHLTKEFLEFSDELPSYFH